MNLDRQFYTVFCRDVVTERTLADVCSRAETIRDIARGQITDVVAVMESNPVEHTARDVSEDFAREVAAQLPVGEPIADDLRNFIETYTGVGTVLRPAAQEFSCTHRVPASDTRTSY